MFTFNELCELLGWPREKTLKFIKEVIEKGTVKWKHKHYGGISIPMFDIEGCFGEEEEDEDQQTIGDEEIGDPSELTEWEDFDPDC